MKEKNNKRKILIILLLFAIVSMIGYGVYSYYWTEGNFKSEAQIISYGFNPTFYDGMDEDGYTFIGDGYISQSLHSYTCYVDTRDDTIYHCSQGQLVNNQGTSPVIFEAIDISVTKEDDANLATISNITNNGQQVIQPGDTGYVSANADLIINDSGQEVTEPVYDGDFVKIKFEYKIKATEVHE